MEKPRIKFSASFKAEMAIVDVKEQNRLHGIADQFQLNPTQISNWKLNFFYGAKAGEAFRVGC
jgi:transposase